MHFYNLVGFMSEVNLITWDKSLAEPCPGLCREGVSRGAGGHMGGTGGHLGGTGGPPGARGERLVPGWASPSPPWLFPRDFSNAAPTDGPKPQEMLFFNHFWRRKGEGEKRNKNYLISRVLPHPSSLWCLLAHLSCLSTVTAAGGGNDGWE